MPLLSSQAKPLAHAPCSSLSMPAHFPLLGWVCASVCHSGETAPPHRALLPPDSLNFTPRPPAAAKPPTARPCGLSLPKGCSSRGRFARSPWHARWAARPRVPLTHESATGDSVGVRSHSGDPHRDYSRIIPDQNFLLSTHWVI